VCLDLRTSQSHRLLMVPLALLPCCRYRVGLLGRKAWHWIVTVVEPGHVYRDTCNLKVVQESKGNEEDLNLGDNKRNEGGEAITLSAHIADRFSSSPVWSIDIYLYVN
jgi:hypothetical protein